MSYCFIFIKPDHLLRPLLNLLQLSLIISNWLLDSYRIFVFLFLIFGVLCFPRIPLATINLLRQFLRRQWLLILILLHNFLVQIIVFNWLGIILSRCWSSHRHIRRIQIKRVDSIMRGLLVLQTSC